jgi:hypothetical protein
MSRANRERRLGALEADRMRNASDEELEALLRAAVRVLRPTDCP